MIKNLKTTPFPYQLEGIQYALKHKYCMIADEMGLGKSLQAIAVAGHLELRTLVVCPAFLKENWKREVNHHSQMSRIFDYISYSSLEKMQDIFKDVDLVIADEFHYLKNINAKRTQLFHKLIEEHKPKRLILLSGTPIKNRVPEFFSPIRLCTTLNPRVLEVPFYLRNYWKFCQRYSFEKKVHIGGGRTATKFEGHRNVDELKRLLKRIYIRRRSKDVLDLPEINRQNIFTNKQRRNEELERAWDSYNNGESSNQITKVKLASALTKTKTSADLALNILETQPHVIIFTDFIDVSKEIGMLIGAKATFRVVNSKISMNDRNIILNDFFEGKFQILVATIGTCSVGLTLTNCTRIIFNDMPWVPADIMQAEKRIHRIGQDEKCFIYRVLGSPADALIVKNLTEKIETIKEVV